MLLECIEKYFRKNHEFKTRIKWLSERKEEKMVLGWHMGLQNPGKFVVSLKHLSEEKNANL